METPYDAVYLAIGAQKSSGMAAEGGNLKGVVGAVEFLRDVNLGKKPPVGEKVAIVGGGNSAIDASRSALRLGAKEVTILYRRTREDMPAQEEEIKAAEEEGVKIQYLVNPVRFQGSNGRIEQVICRRMVLGEFDKAIQMEGEALRLGKVAYGETSEFVAAALTRLMSMSQ